MEKAFCVTTVNRRGMVKAAVRFVKSFRSAIERLLQEQLGESAGHILNDQNIVNVILVNE